MGSKDLQIRQNLPKMSQFKHILDITAIWPLHTNTFLIVTNTIECPKAKLINHRAPGMGKVVIFWLQRFQKIGKNHLNWTILKYFALATILKIVTSYYDVITMQNKCHYTWWILPVLTSILCIDFHGRLTRSLEIKTMVKDEKGG